MFNCSTRSNYDIPIDSSNFFYGTQLHDDPLLCPFPVVALTLIFFHRRRSGHPDAAAAAIAAVLPLSLLQSSYRCFQVKLELPPLLLLPSCHCCCYCLDVSPLSPSQAHTSDVAAAVSVVSPPLSCCYRPARFTPLPPPLSSRRQRCRYV